MMRHADTNRECKVDAWIGLRGTERGREGDVRGKTCTTGIRVESKQNKGNPEGGPQLSRRTDGPSVPLKKEKGRGNNHQKRFDTLRALS
mmetsp:Transcript_36567/g.71915  ORF Transcript_36567/g.71915 Transcript_36567/m.71915 type:complete len:89 (-) Transcript_36567:623-889(-)